MGGIVTRFGNKQLNINRCYLEAPTTVTATATTPSLTPSTPTPGRARNTRMGRGWKATLGPSPSESRELGESTPLNTRSIRYPKHMVYKHNDICTNVLCIIHE